MSVDIPHNQETQTPGAPPNRPEVVGTSRKSPATATSPFDLVGTPDFKSPTNWGNLPVLNTEVLRTWKPIETEGLANLTPPVFRVPTTSPPPNRRKSTSPVSRRRDRMEVSPGGSFRDLLRSASQSTEQTSVREDPTAASSGSKGKAPESSRASPPESAPEPQDKGKGPVEDFSPRRSSRIKGVQKTP